MTLLPDFEINATVCGGIGYERNDPPASPEGEADGGQARRRGETARRRLEDRGQEELGTRD